MKRIGLTIGMILLITAQAGLAMAYGEAVFSNPIYATQAGASYYYVTDQTVNLWGDDGDGNPTAVGTQDNDNVTVIQGADQNWGGTGNIMPGLINYANFLGTPDYAAAGFGGAASGGTFIVGFDQDIVDGDGIDFLVHGFGFCFNEAFSAERGTVSIYAATSAYNPTISAADYDGTGPLGEVTITGDETQWVLLSTWKGWGDWDNDPSTADTWIGNPDMDYASSPGAYGEFLWGDLADGGLESARYIKFELGDGGHYINSYTGAEDNNGRALFIDAVEARGYEAPANQAPVLATIGNKQTNEGELLTFTLQATDPEEDGLTFSYSDEPEMAGATFDANSGVFAWTPPDGSDGSYTVTFTVTDDGTPPASDQETIEIAVGNVNHSPVFDENAPASSYAALEGQTITFTVSATDPDGDNVSLDGTDLPEGATFTGGSFSWSTDSGDVGGHTLTFTATDDGSPSQSATRTVSITVVEVNGAPVFDDGAPATAYTANEGETITFSVSATDPEGDTVSYCISDLPDGAGFLNSVFIWTTDAGDAGTYTLEFTATDDGSPGKSARQNVTLTVVAGVSQHAGADQVVTEQTSVTLGVPETGDGQSDTYQWVQTSGPEVTLSDAAAAAPTFIAPKVEADGTVLTFQSTLNSDLTDDVQITVQDNGIQLTTEENQQFETADLVFDNAIGADINAQDHCHMGIASQEGELIFYDILDPADMADDESAPENLIYGLFEFGLTLPSSTQTAVWSVFFPEAAPKEYRWYKYNAASGEWIDFSRDEISGGTGDGAEFNADRTQVTIYVTDGGAYDDDGIVNQKVSDPSGVGMKSATNNDGDGDGGGGGCFIGTIAD
jgi:hypothetical protein